MRAAARDDAGDVRAVAAVVDRRAAAADEILVGANAAQRKIRMRRDAGVDDRDRDAVAGRADRRRRVCRSPVDLRAEVSRAGALAEHANAGVERDLSGVARISLLKAAALPKTTSAGTRFRIDGANRGAAIEQAVERRIALRRRRKLHDDARRLAGRHRRRHRIIGVARRRRSHSQRAHMRATRPASARTYDQLHARFQSPNCVTRRRSSTSKDFQGMPIEPE